MSPHPPALRIPPIFTSITDARGQIGERMMRRREQCGWWFNTEKSEAKPSRCQVAICSRRCYRHFCWKLVAKERGGGRRWAEEGSRHGGGDGHGNGWLEPRKKKGDNADIDGIVLSLIGTVLTTFPSILCSLKILELRWWNFGH